MSGSFRPEPDNVAMPRRDLLKRELRPASGSRFQPAERSFEVEKVGPNESSRGCMAFRETCFVAYLRVSTDKQGLYRPRLLRHRIEA